MEATNKTLLKVLKKFVNDSDRDWHLQINLVLWAYHTSFCTFIGTALESLLCGTEEVLPIEVELPSLRIFFMGPDNRNVLSSMRKKSEVKTLIPLSSSSYGGSTL